MSTNRTANQRTGPDGRVIAVAVGLVVVVAAVAALLIAGGDDESDTTAGGSAEDVALANFGAVQVDGQPLPPLGDGNDPAIGQHAPTIVSEQASGTVEVDPGADGEPTVLVFLAHWCPHCQAELPHYVELADDGAFDGMRTVAVLTSSDERQPNFPPSAWLDDEGWTGERFFDDRDSSAAAAYGLSSFPYAVFVDSDGKVVARFSGEQPTERILEAVELAKG